MVYLETGLVGVSGSELVRPIDDANKGKMLYETHF